MIGTYFIDDKTKQVCRVVAHNEWRGDDQWYCAPITEPKLLGQWTDRNGITHTKYDGFTCRFTVHSEWIKLCIKRHGNPRKAVQP
jgi:hypothetical protein